MTRAVSAEWVKIRTLPGTGWLLLGAIAVTVAVSAATSAALSCTFDAAWARAAIRSASASESAPSMFKVRALVSSSFMGIRNYVT